MNIEIKLAFEVMRAEFSKVGLIPDDDVGCANFVEPCPAGKQGVDDGWYMFEVLEEEFSLIR